MNAQQFTAELCKRLNLRRGQTMEIAFEEAEAAARKLPSEMLPGMLEACLDAFATVPSRAEILALADKQGIAKTSGAEQYAAYLCTYCRGKYAINHAGTRCPYCGERKTGAQEVLLSNHPIALAKGAA